jgi:hypothetical protein
MFSCVVSRPLPAFRLRGGSFLLRSRAYAGAGGGVQCLVALSPVEKIWTARLVRGNSAHHRACRGGFQPPSPGVAGANAADQLNRSPVESQVDGCAQSVAGRQARRWTGARKGGRSWFTPRGGVESGVDNRRRGRCSWQRDGVNVPPSGGADWFANWPGPAAPGRAPSALPSGALAAGGANGKGSPAQKAGPTPRPLL